MTRRSTFIVGGALIARQIMGTVFGAEYEASIAALTILVCTLPFTMSKEVDLIALVVAGREGTVMRMTGAAVLVNLALNIVLIPKFGMIGAAWSTLVTEAVRAIFARVCARRAGYPNMKFAPVARALAAASAMGLALWFALRSAPDLALPLALGLGALVYLVALTALGGIKFRPGAWPLLRG